jgi:hypothetical protein
MSDIDPAQIQQLMNSLGLTSAQAEDVARSLGRLSQSTRGQTTAADAQASAADRASRSIDSLKSAGGGFRDGLVTAASSINSMNSSVGGTREVFMALIPPINFAHDILQKLVLTTGGLVGAFAKATPFFSSLGLEAQKAFMAGVDVIISAAKNQIQETQKLVNEYKSMTDAGMIFGGSMTRASQAAHDAGISMETFSAFASKSAPNLALLGGNAQDAAGRMMKMTTAISPGLLSIYGTMDNLAGEVTDYVALQSKLGIDAVANQAELQKGAKSYLLNQKELSNLTGKRTEELKQEEAERRKSAAYQLRLSEMSTDEAANTQTALTRIRQTYGEEAYRYMMDVVATNGRVISRSGQMFRAFAPAQAEVIDSLYNSIGQSQDVFKQSQARIIQDNADVTKAQAQANRELLILNSQGYLGDIGTMLNSVNSTALATQTQQKNAVEAQIKATNDTAAAMSKLPDIVDKAVSALEGLKIKFENITISNLPMVNDAIDLSKAIMEPYAEALGQVRTLTSALMDPTGSLLVEFAKMLGIVQGRQPQRQPNELPPAEHPIDLTLSAIQRLYEWLRDERDNPHWTPQNPMPVQVVPPANTTNTQPPNPEPRSRDDRSTNDRNENTTEQAETNKANSPANKSNLPVVVASTEDDVVLAMNDVAVKLTELITHTKDGNDTLDRILTATKYT